LIPPPGKGRILVALIVTCQFNGPSMRTLDPTREQHILCCAAQLFSRRHYHEVRMEDVAAQAGVAKGTLYRYFEDKDDLYRALTIHGLDRLMEESQAHIAGPGRPEDRLLAYITGVVRFYERQPYFLDLIARVAGFSGNGMSPQSKPAMTSGRSS